MEVERQLVAAGKQCTDFADILSLNPSCSRSLARFACFNSLTHRKHPRPHPPPSDTRHRLCSLLPPQTLFKRSFLRLSNRGCPLP